MAFQENPQTMPEGWIFQALWKHHAETRAKVCVPDTVLIKDGAPYRWLFTSRQGEVVRKRALDLVAVRDRFSKISLVHKNNEQRLVASLRERGTSSFDPAKSVPRCLGTEKFTEFIGSRLSQSGNRVVALQAFVPSRGEAGTAFHNTYEVNLNDPHGRSVTSTTRHRYWKSGEKHDESNSDVSGPTMAPVRVRDQRLCSDFDATTLAIVQYVQRQHRVRIITMSCEYVVDSDSRIWFTWGWNITVQKHKRKKSDEGETKISLVTGVSKKHERLLAAGSKDAIQAEKMLGSAVERVETGFIGDSVKNSLNLTGGGKGGGSNFGIRRGGQTSPRGNPGPNMCHGDFCDFIVSDPAVLSSEQKTAKKMKSRFDARELFTENEMSKLASRLGSDAAVNEMLSGKGGIEPPTASNTMLFKSIALARKEKRGMVANDTAVINNNNLNTISGGSELLNPEDIESMVINQPRESVLTRSTDAHRMKVQRTKARQLGMDGGAANYYKSVRVCSTCYCVYSTLDAARDILNRQQMQHTEFLPRTSHRVVGGSSVLTQDGGPMLDDVSEFEDSVRSKAHTFGASRRATSRAAKHKAAARRREQDAQRDGYHHSHQRSASQYNSGDRSSVLLPEIQNSYNSGVHGGSTLGGGSSSHLASGGGSSSGMIAENERKARVTDMPWKEKQVNEMKSNPKKALQERRRQREMTKGGHEMDRFQNLEEYVRRSAPSPERDAESSIPDDASLTDEQLDELDAMNVIGDVGHILLLDEEPPTRNHALETLRRHGFEVDVASDGTRGLSMFKANPSKYDALLASRSLPGIDGVEITKIIRRLEQKEQAALDEKNEAAAFKRGLRKPKKEEVRRVPIIAFTEMASQEDLRLYMEIGMDGCVSKPLNEQALLATMTAAIPHHNAAAAKGDNNHGGQMVQGQSRTAADQQYGVPSGQNGAVVQFRPATTRLAMVSSQSIVEKSLKMPVQVTANVSGGIFQMDADTAIPYTVLGEAHPGSRLFNFVVCHDLFDTCENAQIFFRPIVSKYPGMQVLVWNYPGQAFSEWRRDVTLNNKYLAGCLDSLLRHVGVQGTAEFRTDGSPFYLLGFGLGGNIGSYFACHYAPNGPFSMSLRAVLNLNGYSYVGPHIAGVLHDCMNVFACSPANRPDLPVYFWTRFLFSATYLTRVSAPLALNLYTAVHNPITLEGRIQLCQGTLASVDLRASLRKLHYPCILVHSAQNGLVKPTHVAAFVETRGGEIRSIQRALKFRKKACVIWMKAGHELFQECRKPLVNLVEQLATGFHETHDVSFFAGGDLDASGPMPAGQDSNHMGLAPEQSGYRIADDAVGSPNKKKKSPKRAGGGGSGNIDDTEMFEDKFIDNILGTLHDVRTSTNGPTNPFQPTNDQIKQRAQQMSGNQRSNVQWEEYAQQESMRATDNARSGGRSGGRIGGVAAGGSAIVPQGRPGSGSTRARQNRYSRGPPNENSLAESSTLDPTHPSFERRENSVYQATDSSKIYPSDFPEVREYMKWRVQRNKKRLRKLTSAASCIQKGFRSYMARTLIQRMRQERAALFIQRNWRGLMGRRRYAMKRKEEWAVRLLQRNWRGKAGREAYLAKREQRNAAMMLQRIYRGRVAKRRVFSIRDRRERSAIYVQKAFRAKMAREYAFRRRQQRNASIEVQRTWRGCLGRRRAALERDKYLFSKAQSQGIEFGRQMLMEHKLHGTRLQSEVALLTREKVEAEDQVETLLKEIAQFEEGVRTLEKEMHELSKVETEAKGVLDEEARVELREQKMRLDREFSIMLQKIADRKDQLGNLEGKLQTLDRHRQAKEEELRDLERKLVVLLEEQQKELEQIKQRQERRGERFISDDPEGGAILAAAVGGGNGGGGGGDDRGYQGPSQQQQQQAAALMQSTETLMKFGFMSMSLTYFSSLNMIRAMRATGALETILAGKNVSGGPMAMISQAGQPGSGLKKFTPTLKGASLPGQEEEDPRAWSVEDVGKILFLFCGTASYLYYFSYLYSFFFMCPPQFL
jgi:DNA-binding response OmpR family regulator